MSTRAHIIIEQGETVFHLSHHCDGYPDGVGHDLVELLKEYVAKLKDPYEWSAGSLWEFIYKEDEEFHPTKFDISWDQEYVYVIDCNDRTLKGFYKGITDPRPDDPYELDTNHPLYIYGNIFNFPGEFEEVLGYTKADDKKEEPKKAKASVIASFFESFSTNPAGSPKVLTELSASSQAALSC